MKINPPKRSIRLTLIAILSLLTTQLFAQEEDISKILEEYEEAMGGKAKIRELQSVRLTGEILREDEANNIPITVFKKQPNKSLITLTLKDSIITEGYDGKTAWRTIEFKNGSQRHEEITGKDKLLIIMNATLTTPLLHSESNDIRLERLEDKTTIRTECYRIKATFSNNESIVHWIDKDGYRDRRIEYFDAEDNLVKFIIPGNFEIFEGVLFAKSTTVSSPTEITSKINIDSVRTNLGLMDILFAPPEELTTSSN